MIMRNEGGNQERSIVSRFEKYREKTKLLYPRMTKIFDDLIKGYRADDSYFSYAQSFVHNALPLRSLSKALMLGKLGEQTVLISEKAFAGIEFINAEPVEKELYYPKFISRDTKARQDYQTEIKKTKSYRDDIFVMDIIREEIKNDDSRIQRIILK